MTFARLHDWEAGKAIDRTATQYKGSRFRAPKALEPLTALDEDVRKGEAEARKPWHPSDAIAISMEIASSEEWSLRGSDYDKSQVVIARELCHAPLPEGVAKPKSFIMHNGVAISIAEYRKLRAALVRKENV